MTKDQLISLFFIALLIFIVYQVLNIFSPFVHATFWSAILAFGFYPFYAKFRKMVKTHDAIAAFLATFVIFLIVIPPMVVLVVNVTGQAIELSQATVNYIREGKLEQLIEQIREFSVVQRLEAQVFEWNILKDSLETWILNSTRAVGNFTASQVGNITKNFFIVILNIVLMVVLVFIFLKDGHKIYQFIYDIAPLEKANKESIFMHINETFAAVIRGQLLTCLVQALIAGLIFWVLGIPVPIIFALALFISSLIPFIGATGVWLPLVIFLVIQQSYVKAIILLLVGVFIISLIDNILKPAIIGEKTRLPYFLLLFGILGGVAVYGLMGIFLAPVVLSLFFALIKIYQEKYL